MDPDNSLREARLLVKRIRAVQDAETSDEVLDEDDVFDLADAFEALDEWLSKGGYLPQPWSEAGKVGTDVR